MNLYCSTKKSRITFIISHYEMLFMPRIKYCWRFKQANLLERSVLAFTVADIICYHHLYMDSSQKCLETILNWSVKGQFESYSQLHTTRQNAGLLNLHIIFLWIRSNFLMQEKLLGPPFCFHFGELNTHVTDFHQVISNIYLWEPRIKPQCVMFQNIFSQ